MVLLFQVVHLLDNRFRLFPGGAIGKDCPIRGGNHHPVIIRNMTDFLFYDSNHALSFLPGLGTGPRITEGVDPLPSA
jgi:hypothetical protein